MAHPLQPEQDAQLLLRRHAAEQIYPAQLPDQRFLRHVGERVSGQHTGHFDTDFAKHMPRHFFVVAGEQLNCYTVRPQFSRLTRSRRSRRLSEPRAISSCPPAAR